MNLQNKILFLLTIGLIFLNAFTYGAKLSLPIELTIENGNFKDCMVHVTKNGEDIITTAGKSTLRIHLDFNYNYLLTFSKPGYITKKVAVNTTVTAERQQQLFEPYKIGVKLFKQYEGINIVVYSQPVAKIKFNPALDDFDYDVDYTKSILSQLQSAEQELETRAANERQMIASGQLPREGFETIAAASERFAHYPNINGGKEKLTEPPPPTYKTTSEIHSWQDPPESSKLNGGADEKNPSSLNRGDDRIPNPSINKGDDDKVKPANVEGVNKAKGILDSDSGVEKGNPLLGGNDADNRNTSDVETVSRPVLTNTLESNKGDDARNADAAQLQKNPTKTREFIIEPNRTITTININNGLNPVLYRKVLYNWGGLYYFKNLSISISENMFELGTGEK